MRNLTLVVLMIGLTVLSSVFGVIILAAQGRNIPDVLPVIIASGISGLLGLLVRPGPDAPPNP